MKFPSIAKHISKDDNPILPDEFSRRSEHIPDIIKKYGGGFLGAAKTRLPSIDLMVSCLVQARKSAKSIRQNPKMGKKFISKAEIKEFEAYAKDLGVDDIGYTKVERNMIFLKEQILYENAIVLTIRMRKSKIKTAPSKTAIREIFSTYNKLGIVVNKISEHLRNMGYNAMAGPALGGAVSYVPLAQKAGLGAIGKHGLIITDKEFGPSIRLAAIYTDIENLPDNMDNPHMWIKEFCDTCNKCVRACPTGAIYTESIEVNGNPQTRRCIDMKKCATPFAKQYGCTICIKECMFFNGDYNKIKKSFTKEGNRIR